MSTELTQQQREAMEALEYVAQAEDAVSVIHQIRFRAEIERIRTCILNSTPTREDCPVEFSEWLCREIPPGTVVTSPAWWAPRIYRRAMLAAVPTPEDSRHWPEDHGHYIGVPVADDPDRQE